MYPRAIWICIIFVLTIFSVTAIKEKFEKPCDEDWIYLDDYCYWSSYQLVAKNSAATPLANWFGAQLYCLTIGANLVHFSNDFEKGLISSMVACSPSWLGLVLRNAPDKTAWVWWGSCDDADHLVTKYEPNCGSHKPTVARLDPKGVVVADYPDVRLPFVCKKFAYPVDKDCNATTTATEATMTTEQRSNVASSTEEMISKGRSTLQYTEQLSSTEFGSTLQYTNQRSTKNGSTLQYTEGGSTLQYTTHYVGESTVNVDATSDGLTIDDGSGFSESTVITNGATLATEKTTVETSASTNSVETSAGDASSGTTATGCRLKCFTGFLDEDSECCEKRLTRRDVKRFYDEKTQKCYYVPLNLSSPVDYFSAQLECQEQGMHLSSVHSADENHVVGFLSMCKNMWIGLENVRPQDVCNCNGWAWEDFTSQSKNNSICSDFTHNFFDKSLVPLAPVCVSSSQCVYIYPQSLSHGAHQYYWKNCFCYDLENFMCVDQQNIV